MKAKQHLILACCMMGMTLLGAQRAWAGPYPLDQLADWLKDAETRLAFVNATIAELELQMKVSEKSVVKLETVIRFNRTANAKPEADLMIARAATINVRQSLAEARAKRTMIMNEIANIRIQIEAWADINGSGAE